MSTARTQFGPGRILGGLGLLLTVACGGDAPTVPPDSPSTSVPESPPEGDTIPPTLVSVGFSPRNVSVTNDPELVSIVARLRDQGSGVIRASAQFRNPVKAEISSFTDLSLFKGDAHQGRYEGFVLIPRGAPGGKWTLMFVQAEDRAGNNRVWGPEELKEMGIPLVLRVSSG